MKYKIKKIFLSIFLVLLLFVSALGVVSCGDNGNEGPVITQEELEGLVFNDITVPYTGEKYSIFLEEVPEGVEVLYVDNEVSMPGKHTVTAIIRYNGIRITKTAVITIEKSESVLTAPAEQDVILYGGKITPKYEVSTTGQSIAMNYFKDGVKVSKNEIFQEGSYEVEIYARENSYYKESNHVTIKLNVVQSQFGLGFESQEIIYDGTEKEIKLSGEVPSGYTVEYSNNKGTEVGTYYALANVKDSSGNVVETHAAYLDIVYAENPEFAEFLDEFFVEYLEGDQLSVNIFCENPSDFGLQHYEASWYEYGGYDPEDLAESIEYFELLMAELTAFKDANLSVLQQSAYETVYEFLEYYLNYFKIPNAEFMEIVYVDSFGGYVADFGTYMEAYSLRSEQEVKDIVSYVQSTKTAFPSYLEFITDKEEAGFALSDYTINEMRGYIEDIISEVNEKGSYYLEGVLCNNIDKVEFLSEEEKTSYKNQIVDAFANYFVPGVTELYNGLESHLGKLAEDAEGYWQTYENGKELYVLELERLLGLELDMDAYIKELDTSLKSLVGKVISKQNAAYKALGAASYEDFVAKLSQYPITLGKPEQMIEFLKEFAKTIVPDLKSDPEIYIKNMDLASAEVSNAVAYYMKSALDNTKGENITLNPTKLGDSNDVLGTLAHEGYPGHLYAYVYSKELGLSNLATVMTSTAHGEGWATYVETKLYEYAIANSDDDKFIAVMEYLLANSKSGHILEARLDIGVHYEGWDASDVGKYMKGVGYNSDGAEDIFRLLIEMPTTYHAYGYGRLTFVKLHEEAQDILGGFYDEVEFNAMLLSKGWTNLGILQQTYEDYMQKKCHECGIEYKA